MEKGQMYSRKNAYRIIKEVDSKYITVVEHRINPLNIEKLFNKIKSQDNNAEYKIKKDLLNEFSELLDLVFLEITNADKV